LLEGSPEWFDIETMQADLVGRIPEIGSAHHVHVWGLTPQDLMLTMHVKLVVEPQNPTEIVRRVKRFLRENYGIDHSTIEIETDDCSDR
jgi:cobalt-zinc-cadmium efflux system protein